MDADEIRKAYEYGGMWVEIVWRRPARGERLEIAQVIARHDRVSTPMAVLRPEQVDSLSKLLAQAREASKAA